MGITSTASPLGRGTYTWDHINSFNHGEGHFHIGITSTASTTAGKGPSTLGSHQQLQLWGGALTHGDHINSFNHGGGALPHGDHINSFNHEQSGTSPWDHINSFNYMWHFHMGITSTASGIRGGALLNGDYINSFNYGGQSTWGSHQQPQPWGRGTSTWDHINSFNHMRGERGPLPQGNHINASTMGRVVLPHGTSSTASGIRGGALPHGISSTTSTIEEGHFHMGSYQQL